MTIGDKDDMLRRLRSLRPSQWFPFVSTITDDVQSMFANIGATVYTFMLYVRSQTRIGTASGFWLDIAAWDYFGLRYKRTGQDDNTWRAAIVAEILRARVTRAAISDALSSLVGKPVRIFEQFRVQDTGAYGHGLGYGGPIGGWGTYERPAQSFVEVARPTFSGVPIVAGYGSARGGYSVASYSAYISPKQDRIGITDQDIRDNVNATRAAGSLIWLWIRDALFVPPQLVPVYGYLLDPLGFRIVLPDDTGIVISITLPPPTPGT